MRTLVSTWQENDRRSVVYFQQNPVWGACEQYFVLLIEGIDKRRFKPSLVCPASDLLNPMVEAVGSEDTVVRYSDTGMWTVPRLAYVFRRLRPDIVHFNDPCLKGIAAARLAGIKRLVMTYHTPEHQMDYNWKGRLLWWADFMAPIHTIALSDRNREILAGRYGFPRERISVIPHGLKVETFDGQHDGKDVRRKIGIPVDSIVLINVARLARQKGHEVLIGAIEELLREVDRSRLRVVLVGDGEDRTRIQEMIVERHLQDVFILTGHRNDVPRLLSCADVFVLSSHFEGLPFAVLEAMAMGRPVVTTDVGGLAETVKEGETGFIVPPGNPSALAEAIVCLIRDQAVRARMGAAGRLRFEQFFVWSQMVARTEELYEGILR